MITYTIAATERWNEKLFIKPRAQGGCHSGEGKLEPGRKRLSSTSRLKRYLDSPSLIFSPMVSMATAGRRLKRNKKDLQRNEYG